MAAKVVRKRGILLSPLYRRRNSRGQPAATVSTARQLRLLLPLYPGSRAPKRGKKRQFAALLLHHPRLIKMAEALPARGRKRQVGSRKNHPVQFSRKAHLSSL